MTESRLTLLNCVFPHPPEKLADAYAKSFTGTYPANRNQQQGRQDDMLDAMALVIIAHLSYTHPLMERRIQEGFDIALDYFLGEWWKIPNPYVDYCVMLDKSHPARDLAWFQAFSRGLFLGLLSARWDDVARLCSWVDCSLRPEYIGNELETEACLIYISIAASLRPEPMSGLQEMEAIIRSACAKRPRLLLDAWEAARNGDQAGYNKAMLASLKHFDKTYGSRGSGMSIFDYIAQHQTIIQLAASRLGLEYPPLPARLSAMLVTRSSLGLKE